jgi:hypothetical protein
MSRGLTRNEERALQRFLRLVAANLGDQTPNEVTHVLDEILADERNGHEQLADLLSVAAAVGAAWAHKLAEELDETPQEAMQWIDAGVREAFGHREGTDAE